MNKSKMLVLAGALAFGVSSSAFAIPQLQLDIKGGTYDDTQGVETVIASSDQFDLYAYGLPNGDIGGDKKIDNWLTTTFYLSVAIMPKLPSNFKTDPSIDLGTFGVNGTTYSKSELLFGNPPVETYTGNANDKDLSPHSIFETGFIELSFNFDASNKATPYNTQDNAGQGPTLTTSSTDFMYFKKFNIDASGLKAGYGIHFDLYTVEFEQICITERGVKTCLPNPNGNEQIVAKAPFSHDAQSCVGEECITTPTCDPNGPPCVSVPEPNMLALLGMGLLGLAGMNMRYRRASLKA